MTAVVPPSVPASPLAVVPVVLSTNAPPPGGCISGSADTSNGMPFGVKFEAVTAPSPSATGTPDGVSMPAFGSCSTSTSSASPHVFPVSASRLDRPTVHAGYWPIIAAVNENTSNATSSHARTPNGDSTIRRTRRHRPSTSASPSGGGVSRLQKWNHAATNSTRIVRPNSIVVKPNSNSGSAFAHGTPKLETYQYPLTLANDSAVMNNTSAATTAGLRRARITVAVTATAASAPSEPANPANTPKWWVHFVGVNIIAMNEMIVMPRRRRLGPGGGRGSAPRA